MKAKIEIQFPFKIDNNSQVSLIETEIERKENIISFSLPYDILLEAKEGRMKLKKELNKNFIYVFEFDNINEALKFYEKPSVFAIEEEEGENVDELENEMNRIMLDYERDEKKIVKRKKYVDEDGFTHFNQI